MWALNELKLFFISIVADKLLLVDQTLKGSYQISNVNVFEIFLKELIEFFYIQTFT